MNLKLILSGFLLIFAIQTECKSQIFITKLDCTKEIQINSNDRIKIAYKSGKKYNGIYNLIFHGKNATSKYGKLISYNDSSLVFRTWISRKEINIMISEIISLNKYNPYALIGTVVVSSAGLVLVIVSSAIIDAPIAIGYLIVGGLVIGDINDLCIYPYKNVKKGKWKISIK